MPTPQDQEFVRFAVASGHLTQEQGDRALQALVDIEGLGGTASAEAMLLRQGLIDEPTVGRVRQAIAATKTTTRIPKELSGFELIEKIGQGGMGSVFRATQKDLGRDVALKVLAPRLGQNERFVQRFLREARAAGRLSHPNIVAAIDVGESQGYYYFAMEFVDGESLAQLIAREGPLPVSQALAIATDVARALEHAQERGLIHRDIKPDNILIDRDGRVRVADFGLAKMIGKDAEPGGKPFVGTPAYVAPEQIRSEADIDCRADIFSLGVALFEMLAGQRPFTGANPVAVAAAVASEPLPSIRKIRGDAPMAVARILERMTAKDRSGRYATASELIAALDHAAKAPRPAAKAPRPAAKAPRPAAKAARPAGRAAPPSGPPGAPPPPRRAATRRRQSSTGAYIFAFLAIAGLLTLLVVLTRGGKRPKPGEPPKVPDKTVVEAPEPQDTGGAERTAKRLLARLNAATKAAAAFSASNPTAYVSQIERYQKVLDDFPPASRRALDESGLAAVKEAERAIAQLEAAAMAAARAELAERGARADALFAESKLVAGLRLFDTFPTEYRTAVALRELAALRTSYRTRAAQAFDAMDEKGRALVRENELDAARALYASVDGIGITTIETRARRAIMQIKDMVRRQGAVDVAKAKAAYPVLARVTFARLTARDYAGARKALDAAVVDPKLLPIQGKLRGLQTLVRGAGHAWTRILGGVEQLERGQSLRFGGLAGSFDRFEGGRIYFRVGEVTMARAVSELRPTELAALVPGAGEDAQFRVNFGLFLIAEKEYATARGVIGAAAKKGIDVTDARDLLNRFAPRPCPACDGEKDVPCGACNGTGNTGKRAKTCPKCNGRRGGPCAVCRAVGAVRCDRCGGSGRLMGGFNCLNCVRGRIKCSRCGGDGRAGCRTCRGRGVLASTSACPTCAGKKRVPCRRCNGQGELPPLEAGPAPPAASP